MYKLILYLLGIELPEDADDILEFGFNVALICLIIFLCFINVFGYLFCLLLIEKYDIRNKYPQFKRIIDYFSNMTIFWLIVEGIIGFGFLLVLIILGFYPLFRMSGG